MTVLFRSVNPADGEEFARYGKMSWREADAVLDRAARVFASWSSVTAEERAERLAPPLAGCASPQGDWPS